MTWTLRRSERALDDLTEIWDYIATDNPAAADKLVTELLALFKRTADFPMIGRPADEIGENIRILTRGSYLLIYRVILEEQAIELVRLVHCARDWPKLFDA